MFLRLFFIIIITITGSNIFAQPSAGVVWNKNYGYGWQWAYGAAVTPSGDILVVGESGNKWRGLGTVAPDHHGSQDSADAWVIKLDADGNKLWEKSIGGTGPDVFYNITRAPDNNYFCFGHSSSVWPGSSSKGAWLVKLSPDGEVLWSKTYAGSAGILNGGYNVGPVAVLADGGIALSLGVSASFNYSVFRLDAQGNVLWQSTPNNFTGYLVTETSNNQLLTSTGLMFDPVTGDTSRLPNFPWSIYSHSSWSADPYMNPQVRALKKIDGKVWVAAGEPYGDGINKAGYYDEASGTFILQQWSVSNLGLGPDYNVYGDGFDVLPGNSFVFNGFANFWSIGPASSMYYKSYYHAGGKTTILDTTEHKADYMYGVKALPDGGHFLCIGVTRGKFWVVKYSLLNTIRGTVFFDANNNNTRDNGEPLLNNFNVKTSGPNAQLIDRPFGGYFNHYVDTGTYSTFVVLDRRPYLAASPSVKTSTFSSYKNVDSVDFAIQKIALARDYTVSVEALSPARPMFNVAYKITYTNNGTDTLQDKQLRFIKDNHLQVVNTQPPYNTISGDTLFWDINRLMPFEEGYIIVNMVAGAQVPVSLGDVLLSSAYIDKTGDISPENNTGRFCQVVIGSFDPNDKAEAHGNTITKLEMQNGNELTYTIRFQNTGTDTAFNIFVRDTLDVKLDWPTIEMVSGSHPYQLKVKEGKYAEWKFNNILLVDSFHNEPSSHGYITYRIKPKNNLVLGDIINNSASIYFDFNAPVKTNTQSNEVIKTTATWTGEVGSAWEDVNNWDIKAVPDGETLVIVPADVPNYPVVNSNAVCFVLKIDAAASITVNTGFNLEVRGK